MSHAKPVVLVTRRLPPKVEERLVQSYEARRNLDDHVLGKAELEAGLQGADAVITASQTPWDRARIEALPSSVKVLATFSVGFEHIDVAAAKERGLAVGYTPDVLTEAVADITMLCLLAACRRAREAGDDLNAGRWVGWHTTQYAGLELGGRSLGLLGMGRIGQATARRARAFGLTIHYHNRSRLPAEIEEGATYHATLDGLLTNSDILSLHCPANRETRHLLNRATLGKMRPGSILVNTARGALVDEDALIEALASGHLFAAGLDVFENEPHVRKDLLALPNLFALPHVGSATEETRDAMGFLCLDNLDAFFAGRPLPHAVPGSV